MANEITVTGLLSYTNSAQNIPQQQLALTAALFSIAGKNFEEATMSVPTTSGGTAIPLGGLSGLGWAFFKNNDPTNYIELMTAVSGTKFAKLPPGAIALFYIDASITAPAAIANTAACLMQFLILEP